MNGPAGNGGGLLLGGIVLATLTEAIAGTALALGRSDLIGDIHATPDEFAWLDIGYTVGKLLGFMLVPWLLSRVPPRQLLIATILAMAVACGLAGSTMQLELLIILRLVQGLAGGALLVVGQTILFVAFARTAQPLVQALFAMGAVVAPATLAPALQGWLIDSQSWPWIFFCVIPSALAACGLLLLADRPIALEADQRPFDGVGALLLCGALACLTYVWVQGHRWDWLEEPHIAWLTLAGAAALLALLGQQVLRRTPGVIDFDLFGSEDFAFAFIVSFVAGAALFGSAYLIPAFAVSVLAFTPTAAGLLLLPSGGLFAGGLLLCAYLFQGRRIPPFATVPFGILLIMVAMGMLAGSTGESGADDMMAALLLRGLGLGLLFLSITLIAFGGLDGRNLASGIGLFNTGRQLGGLMGVAGLQTLIDHDLAGNLSVLGSHVGAGGQQVIERLASTTAMLEGKGLDALAAGQAAAGLLVRSLAAQATVIAFDTAFMAVTLLFPVAFPILIGIKVGFALHGKAHASA